MQTAEALLLPAWVHCTVNFLLHPGGGAHNYLNYVVKQIAQLWETRLCNALIKLHNFTDTADQKDVILLNFLQHFTANYIEHSYSHLVENLYAHKTKTLDAMTVKRKCGRPPKPKPQIPTSKTRTTTAAKTLTT